MATVATDKAKEATNSEIAAASKAQESLDSAKLSKRYAVGGEVQGDVEDNSKWYCKQAENYARVAQEVTDIIYPDIYINIDTGHLISEGGNNFTVSLNEAGHLISAIGSGAVA